MKSNEMKVEQGEIRWICKKKWFMLIDNIDNVWPRFGWSWEEG